MLKKRTSDIGYNDKYVKTPSMGLPSCPPRDALAVRCGRAGHPRPPSSAVAVAGARGHHNAAVRPLPRAACMSAAYGDEACSCLRCSPSRLLVIFHTLRPTTKLNLGRASPDLDFGATLDRLNKQVVRLEGEFLFLVAWRARELSASELA